MSIIKLFFTNVLFFFLISSFDAQNNLTNENTSPSSYTIDYIQKAENIFFEDLDSAIFYLEQGINYYKEKENWENYINCYNGIGSCYYYKGEFGTAFDYLNQAIEKTKTHLGSTSEALAAALNNLARLQTDFGEYNLALNNYKKVIEIDKALDNTDNLVTTYNNIGLCLVSKGDINEAIEYYKKSFRLLDEELKIDKIQYAVCNELLSEALHLKGALRTSFDAKLKALEYFEGSEKKHGDMVLPHLIKNHWHLAEIAIELDQKRDYLLHAQAAKKFESIQQKKHSTISHSLNGKIALAKNENKDARKYFEQQLDIQYKMYEGIAFHPLIGETFSHIAQSYFNENNFSRSVEYYQRALQHYSKDSLAADYFQQPDFKSMIVDQSAISILHGKAKSLYKLAEKNPSNKEEILTIALSAFDQAILAINYLRKDLFSTASKATLSEKSATIYQDALNCLLLRYQDSPSEAIFEKAFQLVESGKAAILLESINENTAKGFAGIPDSLIEKDSQLKRQISNYQQRLYAINKEKQINANQVAFIENKLFDTKNKHQEFLAMLEVTYPEYYQMKYDQRLASLAEIQAKLPDGQSAFIEYFLETDKLHLFFITKSKAEIHSIAISNNLETQVTALRDFLHQPPNNLTADKDFSQYTTIAHQLFLNLIDPLNIDATINRLIIVPDDLIGYIPFEVLLQKPVNEASVNYSPKKLNYLINDFDISYHYSGTLWNQSKTGDTGKGFLGFAPTFKNSTAEEVVLRDCREEDLYQLKCNEAEVELIEGLISGETLSGKMASKERFINSAADFQILHFATHSCLDDENPMLNKIFLSEDYISNYDLYNIRLNADLVVLSACNTGNGPLLKGEGVMSLFRGFLHAGCPSSLLSFWSVEDCTTKGIMEYYYQELSAGAAKDKALKNAKINFLQNADRLHAHPFYWAPFVQFGNITPLDLTTSFSFLSWKSLLLSLSMVVLIIVAFRIWRK